MSDELRAMAVDVVAWYSDCPEAALHDEVLALARDYLTEHPADDAEPVSDDGLRRLGFTREMQPAASNHLTFRRGAVVVTRWSPTDANSRRWSVQKYREDGPDWLPACLCPTTLGAVRRLLDALGITTRTPGEST